MLVTSADTAKLPRGGVSIVYNLATRAGETELVVRAGRVPERRLAMLLTLPVLAFGAAIAILCATSPREDAWWLGLMLGGGIGIGGAICLWSFFTFATLLQSLRSPLLVIDRLTSRVSAPRAGLSFESPEGLALLAHTHLAKGRHFGLRLINRRAYRRDEWITEVGLLVDERLQTDQVPRYTPLWQRRVSRWMTWVAPTSTPEGVARQLRLINEKTGLPVLAIQAQTAEPLAAEGVEWQLATAPAS